jgi:CelD/BcsL family acetyltransferase involved in cellulose biosynthesis
MSALSADISLVESSPISSEGVQTAVRVGVLHDWIEAESVQREWDELAERSGAEISSCPAYAKVWWKHYGRGQLAIVVCRQGDRLIGVLPMFIDRIGPWPIGARVAKLIGSDSTIAVMTPAIEHAHAEAVVRAAAHALLRGERCDVVHLGPMQGDERHADAIRQSAAGNGVALSVIERRVGVCTRFLLLETFDQYMASLESRQRGNLRRDMNQVAKSSSCRMRVVTEVPELTTAFDEFVSMHAAQWRAEGKPGHFGDWPKAPAFAKEAVLSLASTGRVALVGLEINGEMACWEWCYLLGKRCSWKLPARAVGSKWDKLGLGRLGMVNMLQAMIERGAREVEAGPGHYDYKLKHGATEHPLMAFLLVRAGGLSSKRAAWIAAYADALHLAYYRAWRLKIASRLGIKPGTLWAGWIRSRI